MAKVKVRNVDPQGDLEVPKLGGRIVGRGEVIEVPADIAGELLAQPGAWEPAGKTSTEGGES